MKRNPLNHNHRLQNEPAFQGIPVITHHGPLIGNYLERMHACMERSLEAYSRVCLMRFDLYIPSPPAGSVFVANDNRLIYRFLASLRAKVQHAQEQSRKAGHRVHDTDIRFMWSREVSSQGRLHYHIALLLNHDAYAFIGQFKLGSRNMYNRIHEAWGTALGMYVEDVVGYVHIPFNPTYQIQRGDGASFQRAFYRVSYFAKLATKEYQQGFHTFGCSRL